MISVVCVYNDERSLKDYLLRSLDSQTAVYELILLDNRSSRFKSAAEALNYGGSKAKGKYIMFIHQDVDLCSNTWLGEAEEILNQLPALGIAGVAGISEQGKNIKERGRNVIRHAEDRRIWELAHPIDKPEIVQTLDCCLLIVPRVVFNQLKFDEITCYDWHLYGEDYCLSCKSLGLNAYIIPMFIYHYSRGNLFTTNRLIMLFALGPLPRTYYSTLKNVIRKHRMEFKYISTSGGEWNTYQTIIVQRVVIIIKAGFDLILRNIKRLYNK